jgi:hypothetical protein
MKSQILVNIILAAAMLFGLSSCDILGGSDASGTDPIGGDPSPIGMVGNTFSTNISGVQDIGIQVAEQSGAVSTISYTASFQDATLLPMASAVMGSSGTMQVSGSTISGTRKFRMTTKGVQDVFDDGSVFTIVDYKAKKGDTYKKKIDGKEVVRTVTKVSSDDDFPYAFFLIKVVKVEETGLGVPGISKVIYYGNHRFGMVGMDIVFEDGSEKKWNFISQNDNEPES